MKSRYGLIFSLGLGLVGLIGCEREVYHEVDRGGNTGATRQETYRSETNVDTTRDTTNTTREVNPPADDQYRTNRIEIDRDVDVDGRREVDIKAQQESDGDRRVDIEAR